MPDGSIIANDRQEREVSNVIEQITHALSSEQVLKSLVDGLPSEVIEGVRKSLAAERRELVASVEAYQQAQHGSAENLKARAGSDLGSLLIAARVARGWKQKDLARRLFLPDQQIQRYEAERYRNITLAGLIRVARALGVRLTADISRPLEETWLPASRMAQADLQKVLKHARRHGWLEHSNQSDENAVSQLRRTVADHVGEYGTPSMLRTGMNVIHGKEEDWLLLAWKAQITIVARKLLSVNRSKYRPLNVAWLKKLVELSVQDNGPAMARELLFKHGITLVVEPQIPGMKVDGAAFLIGEMPVIGLTLRNDCLDSFWFTLLHEVAHVILHYRTGLASGFFDGVEIDQEENLIDDLEAEANRFASNLLIPDEIWKRSPARIAKTSDPIERFAKQLGISPAIVFGRVRMERKNYKIFSDKIGRGKVRKLLAPQFIEAEHDSSS